MCITPTVYKIIDVNFLKAKNIMILRNNKYCVIKSYFGKVFSVRILGRKRKYDFLMYLLCNSITWMCRHLVIFQFVKFMKRLYKKARKSGICNTATPRKIPMYPPIFPKRERPVKARLWTTCMYVLPKIQKRSGIK